MTRTILALAVLLVVPPPAAARKVVVEDKVVNSDPNVPIDTWLEVYLEMEPGDESFPNVGTWQSAVDLSPAVSGVEVQPPYAEPSTDPTHPPLSADPITPNFGGDNDASRASATSFLSPVGAPLFDGAGLFRIPIRVAAGAQGSFAAVLDGDPFAGTSIVDPGDSPIPFTLQSGTITVVPLAVPSLGGVGLALIVGLLSLSGGGSLRVRAPMA